MRERSKIVDTRTKILNAEAAVAMAREFARPFTVFTGHFDVMLAEDAGALEAARNESCARTLMVLVTTPPEPVLSVRARAEMAAALRVVDYVVIAEDGPGPEALLATLAPDRTVRAETAHQKRSIQLVEHVHRRQTG